MDSINSLKAKIRSQEEELSKLKETLEALEKEEPLCKLARELHENFCQWNHTDGCSWHYEVKNGNHMWTEWAHAKWLDKAATLISFLGKDNITDAERFIEYVKMMKG
jgi:hypothetical protein